MIAAEYDPKDYEFDDDVDDEGEDYGLEELERRELTGDDDDSSLATSSTDEDEDEAVGDGNIGRSEDDPLSP